MSDKHDALNVNQPAVHAVHGTDGGHTETIICPYCGKESLKTKKNKKFCDDTCKKAYWSMRTDMAKTLAFHKRLIDKLKNDIESLEQRVRELESK